MSERGGIWPYVVPSVWYGVVWGIAGAPAAFFSALTGLAALLFASYEIGRKAAIEERGEHLNEGEEG